MFPLNPLIEELIKKSLARAQELHPIHLSDILVEPTHLHLFLQVIDPQDAADFMERFKCESSHAVNRLLGRKKKTVWCEGYDSPLIEDVPTAIGKIAYIYENPSKDGLEQSVEKYPGFNTFELRQRATNGRGIIKCSYETRYIARTDINPLPEDKILNESDFRRLRRKLIYRKRKNSLLIEPNCWMSRLGAETKEEQQEINRQIVAEVKEREEKHAEIRKREEKPVIGYRRLVSQQIGARYVPERSGRRMITHSVDKSIRKRTIQWAQSLFQMGKDVQERWKLGDFTVPYPLGLFPPTGIRLAEPLGW